jgi:hypothetical protein
MIIIKCIVQWWNNYTDCNFAPQKV